MRPDPQNARSRPVGGGFGRNEDEHWKAVNEVEFREVLRLRQAHRIADWAHISIPVAQVIADLHFRGQP